MCLTTWEINGTIDRWGRELCRENQDSSGDLVSANEQRQKASHCVSEDQDTKVWIHWIEGICATSHLCTITNPGEMRRVPKRFYKDTVANSYSNVAETEKEQHGWENISTSVHPATSLSATLETKSLSARRVPMGRHIRQIKHPFCPDFNCSPQSDWFLKYTYVTERALLRSDSPK